MKHEIPCLNISYIQIKIYLLSILHISLQIQYNLNLKIREDCNYYHHISSVYKTYLQISDGCVLLFEPLSKQICVCSRCLVVLS